MESRDINNDLTKNSNSEDQSGAVVLGERMEPLQQDQNNDDAPTTTSAAAARETSSASSTEEGGAVVAEIGLGDNTSHLHGQQQQQTQTHISPPPPPWLTLNRMVFVQSRTGPGMNSPGGPGHITKLYYPTMTHVDVKYLPGELKKSDRAIPIQYVSDHNAYALEIQTGSRGKARRNRGGRRCGRCLAFASDCGNCDWIHAERVRKEMLEEEERRMEIERVRLLSLEMEREELGGLLQDDGSDSSGSGSDEDSIASTNSSNTTTSEEDKTSSDESEMDSEEEERRKIKILRKNRKRDGKFTRRRQQRRKQNKDGSRKNDDDEVPLAVLQRRKDKREKARKLQRRKEERERTRKLADLHRMLNKEEEEEEDKPSKKKKKRSRTRPDKICALGSLPAVAARSSATTVEEDASKSKANINAGRNEGRSPNTTKLEQTRNDGHSTMTVFDFDSDSGDDTGSKGAKQNIQEDEAVTFEATANHGSNDNDDAKGLLITPKEGLLDDDSSSSDSSEDEIPLKQILEARLARKDLKRDEQSPVDDDVADLDGNEGSSSHVDDAASANGNNDDEHLLTPTEGYLMYSDSDDECHRTTPRDNDDFGNDIVEECIEVAVAGGNQVNDIEWGDLPNFVNDLFTKVEDERIPHVQNELSAMKRRLTLAKKQASASLQISNERQDELKSVSLKSGKLHEFIVKELHRNGIDQCNKAMTRLLSKREKRENKDTLNQVQKKQCRGSAIDVLDLKVAELNDLVREIDARVTSFQKEVEEQRQSAMEASSVGMRDDDDEGDYAFPAADENFEIIAKRQHKNRNTTEKERDHHHQHASRKRKSSAQSRSISARPKRRHHGHSERSSSANHPKRITDAGKTSSQVEATTAETEDQLASDSADEVADTSLNFDSTNIDFVGETDDLDDHQGSVLPDTSGVSRRSTQQRSNTNSQASRGSARQTRTIVETMQSWVSKQTSDVDNLFETANRPRAKSSVGSQSNTKSNRNRQASTRAANSTTARASSSGGATRQNQGVQSATISRIQRARTSSTTQSSNNRRQGSRPRSSNTQSNSMRQGGLQRSKNAADRAVEIPPTRPSIPSALSAEILFDSIPLRQEGYNTADEDHQTHSSDGKSPNDLCHVLKERYPTQLQSCLPALAALKTAMLSKGEELQQEEIVTLFRTLLCIFERKCTTLLDIIQTHPECALFLIDCWCLIFCMLEKKMNNVLEEKDGILFKLFGKRKKAADHILLQVIDTIYSQLLWEEYGKTPTLDSRVFDHLRSLCVRIGAVVPLLPTACDIILNKLGSLSWYLSLTNEQKENDIEKVAYVSAIDPETHKQFISSGVLPGDGPSRLASFKKKIPREEIQAAWSMIGFFSCCTSITPPTDFKKPRHLLQEIVLESECGTLPKGDCRLPPSKLQVDTCSKEIKWMCTLLSSRMLGDLPNLDDFVKQVLKRAVMLESFDEVLNLLPTVSPARVTKSVKQLWKYSSITGSSADLEADIQVGLIDLDTFLLDDSASNACSLMPSTLLLQRCIALAATYAKISMAKKARWRLFCKTLKSLVRDEFLGKAEKLESKTENSNAAGSQNTEDAFTEMFQSIAMATEIKIVESSASSHLREAACYLMLAGVVAQSQYNAPGDGNYFHLNKAFRENIWKHSSDKNMCRHQKYYLERMPGGAPESSSNICLLYTSAKTMTFTTLLHLHVNDFKSEPLHIIERLRNHLLAVKVDDDVNKMEYLLTSIISTLLASCNIMGRLNQRGPVSEQEDECKTHLNSSKSCADVIRSISMWLNLIFGRAKFIMELLSKINPSDNVLVQLTEAMKRLGCSRFFLLVVESLTKALSVIIETATRNDFSKALSNDGCLEKAFRSILGALRSSIALVHACGCGTEDAPEMQNMQSSNGWESAAKVYLSFVKTRIMSSILDMNGNNGQHGKLLCQNQSGGVISVLAALCSINQAKSVFSSVYKMFKPTHNANKDDGRWHLQQMGVCFSCELARLAQHSCSCKALATQHAAKMIKYMIVCLLDSDTLAMFPTCNLSLLTHYDGHHSRSKGNGLLSKSQNHSKMSFDYPDQEAHNIKRMSGDYFDTAGPTYASKNIWSFCENVGHVLNGYDDDDKNHSLQMKESIRSIGGDLMNVCENLRSNKDLLELVPQISVERECLKRFIVFQAILTAVKRHTNPGFHRILSGVGGLNGVISTSLIENLYYLSGIELEVEEQKSIGCDDPDSRYQRAKTLVFQKAYTELCGSLMTLMLRENKNWGNTSLRDLVRLRIIVSAFNEKLDIRNTIEGAPAALDIGLRKRPAQGKLIHMNRNLSSSFFRRTGELLSYASGTDTQYGSTLFNAMIYAATLPSLDTASMDSLFTVISFRLILTPEAIGVCIPLTSDGLERAVDDRLLCAEVLRSDGLDEQKSILCLRERALGSVFVQLLKSHGTKPRLRTTTLKLLTCIIRTFSSKDFSPERKMNDSSGNLASINTHTKLLHSIKECLCSSIRSGMLDATMIKEMFSCVHHIVTVAISRSTSSNESTERETLPLLSMARDSSENSTSDPNSAHLAYIYEASIWFNACGKMLRNQSTTTALWDALNRLKNKEVGRSDLLDVAESNNPEIRQILSSLNSLTTLEKTLSLEKAKDKQISNPYAKGCASRNLPDDTLKAIDDFSNCLAEHGS